VELNITSADVIHSFWVPQLAQKQDAVPGQHNKLVITPIKLGTFPVICTELCGLGHSLMRSHVNIVSTATYASFIKSGGTTTGPPGLAAFQKNGCASCHTLKAASATGTIGPDLDKLKQYSTQANRGSLEAFIKESIVSPGAYVQPGYQNIMPSTFGQQIPANQLNGLVQYLAEQAH
jgi:cytochrome c oxidase subunit 2